MNDETEPAAELPEPPEPSEPAEPAPPAETPKTRTGRARSLTLAGLALGAAAAFGGYELWRHPAHGATAKSAMPASTFLAISLDMKALRGAEWFRRLTDNDAGRLVGLANMKTLCDYDPTAFVDEIDVAIPEKGDHGDFGVVMQAKDHPLDDQALVACATKLATVHGGARDNAAPVVGERDGFSLLQQDGVARFAMRPGGPYLTGRGSWLETMVDSAAGKTPSLDANPEHASLRAAAAKRLPSSSPAAVVVSALLPPEVRAQVRAEVAGETDPSSVAAMNGVLGVSGVGLALGTRGPQPLLPDGKVDVTAELVDLVVELHCESAQACTDVAALLERKRDRFSSDVRVRILGLDSAIESLEVKPDGTSVHVYGHLNPERVVKALGARVPGGGAPGSGVMGRATGVGGGAATGANGGANGGKGVAGDYAGASPYDPAPPASATATATAAPATLPPALTPSAHH
jgi:hypothetical protein